MSSLKAELEKNYLKFTDAITVKRLYAIARVVDEAFKDPLLGHWRNIIRMRTTSRTYPLG